MFKISNLIILVMLLFAGYIIYDNYKRDKLLKGNTAEAKAVVTRLTKPGVRSPARIYYTYKVNSSEMLDFDLGRNKKLKVGDTILIEYSLKDPSYSQIISIVTN